MRLNAFDLPPTGNQIIDALRIIDLQALAIIDIQEKADFIETEASKVPMEEIIDEKFLVLSHTVVVRKLGENIHTRLLFDNGGLMFIGTVLMRNHFASKEAGLDCITIDYYNPQLAGGEVPDQTKISQNIFQLPVREAALCTAIP